MDRDTMKQFNRLESIIRQEMRDTRAEIIALEVRTDQRFAEVHKRINPIEKEQGKIVGKLSVLMIAFVTLFETLSAGVTTLIDKFKGLGL